eukprot:12931528-Prorocentrum_lima.AAC.1
MFTNQIIQLDTMHINYRGRKKVLAIQDEHSGYERDSRIKRETWQCAVKILERKWLAIFGPPK